MQCGLVNNTSDITHEMPTQTSPSPVVKMIKKSLARCPLPGGEKAPTLRSTGLAVFTGYGFLNASANTAEPGGGNSEYFFFFFLPRTKFSLSPRLTIGFVSLPIS